MVMIDTDVIRVSSTSAVLYAAREVTLVVCSTCMDQSAVPVGPVLGAETEGHKTAVRGHSVY